MQMDPTYLALDVRAQDYDRFLCIQLAPAPVRPALYAVTALHAELARIAETVSEPLLGHIRLAWWREALEEIMAGKTPRNHPVVLALAPLHADHPELFAQLLPMIEARAADLDATLIAEENAWLSYLDRTAGALHVAWALLLDAAMTQQHHAMILAQARFYAMIGLARAVPYLQAHGFLRFPAARLQEGESTPSITALLTDAEKLINGESLPKSLKPLTGLLRLARYHACVLRQHSCDPYRIRNAKLAVVLRILQMKFFLC